MPVEDKLNSETPIKRPRRRASANLLLQDELETNIGLKNDENNSPPSVKVAKIGIEGDAEEDPCNSSLIFL